MNPDEVGQVVERSAEVAGSLAAGVVDPTASVLTNPSILNMVLGSGPVVQVVLIILVMLSVWTWAITIAKILQFRRAQSDTRAFSAMFWETRNLARVDDATRRLSASPLAHVFSSGYRELSHVLQNGETARSHTPETLLGTVERALKRAELEESVKLERGITFLATTASAAPFIGLFGTVWGIMNAFHSLGFAKATTIQAVAPGISEALVATAVGLAAAIPAAIAFNFFAVAVRRFRESMDKFSSEFLSLARQHVPAR